MFPYSIHDQPERSALSAVEEYSDIKGYFHPFLANMAKIYQGKPVEGAAGMSDKLCPFDKRPCIKERCEVFREDVMVCSFSLPGIPVKPFRPKKDEKTPSKYTAHLFD
jgi:hypothetical protein